MFKFLLNSFLITLMILSSSQMIFGTPIKHFKLDNGLKVILLHDPYASIVSVKTIVKVGSVYEKNYYGSGISHYLEHIVAGGATTKHTEDYYIKNISLMGGVSNAYTTTDHTSYFINTTPENTNKAIETLYEWMFFNKLDDKEVAREKKVITREIEKNNSNISRKFYYLTQENLYKTHPIKFPVIGYLDKFLSIQKKDLKDFYDTYYVPSNMILVVGGNIDIEKTKIFIEKLFKDQKKQPSPIFYESIQTPPVVARKEIHHLDMNKTLVNLKFPTVKLESKYLYSLDLIDYILGNGTQSMLYKKLVDELNIAFSVYTTSYTPQYCKGYFEIQIETESENTQKVIDETINIINSLKTKKINSTIIKKAKKQKLAENVLSIDSIEDKTSRLALSMFYSDTPFFYDEYASNFKNITPLDLHNTAKKFFNTKKLVTTIGFEKKEIKKDSLSKKENINTNKTEKIILHNGIRVLFYPDNSTSATRAQIISLGGILQENENNNGIGTLYSNLIGNKTSTLSKSKIQSAFEDNGAYTSAGVGNHTFYYTLSSLSEDFNNLFNLFLSTFFDIKFNESEISEEKKKIINRIKQREDDWFTSSSYLFKKEFWKDHPYSLSKIGEIQSIEAIKRKDLEKYSQNLLNPKNIVISIHGNFNKNKVIESIEDLSKKIKKSSNQNLNEIILPPLKQTKEVTNTHKFKTSVLFVGFKGTSLSDISNKVGLDFVDAVLTGMSYPGGRLHNKLRGKGYVYVVHGINFTGLNNGYIYIYALTNDKSINDVKRIIFEEIKDLKNSPVSKEEYDEAIGRMKMYYKQRISSIENKLLINATDEVYTDDYLFSEKYEKEIDKINLNTAKEITKKYFNTPLIMTFNPE